MNSKEIRNLFLDFYAKRQHKIVKSDSIVIKNDPTLLFTNAGMNQFKAQFLSNAKPSSKRIANYQKCLRVSGKHNDLEVVGTDTYHHTMFEMLGNWSFGDYFKKDAIAWAWELLTKVYKIDKNDLYVTVFSGDKNNNLPKDEDATTIWKRHIDENRILPGSKKDNFWEMGEQGPCGPCSEIHIDLRDAKDKAKIPGQSLINKDHPLVVELWNLVFMQYNKKADGKFEALPQKHIDTGMGFERLCMVLQNKHSNYDTDLFQPLIKEIEAISGTLFHKNKKTDIAMRAIADHVRAVCFAIADGQLPSNTGAGYVIRRILRRATRFGYSHLNQESPFIYKLVNVLCNQMGDYYPELKKQQSICKNVIKEEEAAFLKTLSKGLVLLEQIIQNTSGKTVSGKKAFDLYDTYGFPIDLTALILREKGFTLNLDEFAIALQEQKSRSKNAAETTTADWQILIEDGEEEFIGYDTTHAPVKIVKYRKIKTKKDGEAYQLVFNRTPFYPEGGGQVGDKGYLNDNDGNILHISNTFKENNLIIHVAKALPTDPKQTFKAVVDNPLRLQTAKNHTATHLLHQALRKVLGKHVEQKGSLVHPQYLRFDFSHFSKLTDAELLEIENFVNARIAEQLPLQENRKIAYQKAIDEGAIALFGEKYGDKVRTIRFGNSIELCGGTHVKNTADIWHFCLRNEGAIAAGIRRIEAITGDTAKSYFLEQNKTLHQINALLKQPKNLLQSISALQKDNTLLKKQLENLLKQNQVQVAEKLEKDIKVKKNINYLIAEVDLNAEGLKNVAFLLSKKNNNLFLILASKQQDKALIACYLSENLVSDKVNAVKIVRELGKYIQGGGGGQPFFATAGGKSPSGIKEALDKGNSYINLLT